MSKFRFHHDADTNAARWIDTSEDTAEAARAIASLAVMKGRALVGTANNDPFLEITRGADGRLQSSATRPLDESERTLREAIDRWTPPRIGERLRDAFTANRDDSDPDKKLGDRLADFILG